MKVNEYTITDIPSRGVDESGNVEATKIKVKLRLDLHGCLVLESAVAIEEQEVVEEAVVQEAVVPPPATAEATEKAPEEGGAAAADAAEAPKAAEDAATLEAKQKK